MGIPWPSKLPKSVRFRPTLGKKLSQNRVLYFNPALTHMVFQTKNLWLCEYILKKNFKLIISLNFIYDKLNFSGLRKFNKFVLKTLSLHWARVSFKGKGYRLRKFKRHNKLTLNFGHSHWARIALLPEIFFFKKIRRQNYICLTKGYGFFKKFRNDLKFFKKLNAYTKRGLRLKKQYIQRRFGKISQVVSSLH